MSGTGSPCCTTFSGMAVAPRDGVPVRDRLLRAAYDVLLTEGYGAATVTAVARRAGLTTGAIYSNFANKHEMLVRAVLQHWARSDPGGPLHLDPDRAGSDVADGSSALERLAANLARHLTVPSRPEHRLLTEVTGAAIRDRDAEAVLRSGVDFVMAVAADAIDRGKADGLVDEQTSTDALVAVVVALYLGAITVKSFDLPLPDRREVLDLMMALLSSRRTPLTSGRGTESPGGRTERREPRPE
jgi:TetR/AcrR family transcriptional repressor of uid operon